MGPDATRRAAATAWTRVGAARAVVLVEGVSDQIALHASARVSGLDLEAHGVVVVPIGGAHAIGAALDRLVPREIAFAVLCDARESGYVAHAVGAAGRRTTDDGPGPSGLFVCVDDLEDELLRAAGRDRIDRVIDAEGDRRSFATMCAQPAWRDAPHAARVRRFIGAGARRKHRYASALVGALDPAELPAPLVGVLAHVTGRSQ